MSRRKQNDYCRKGDVDGMKKSEWLQCQICGFLHKEEIEIDIENDLYVRVECPHCRDTTMHLSCGDNEDDLYLTYNLNIDPRYY
jgi:hypothetical protein